MSLHSQTEKRCGQICMKRMMSHVETKCPQQQLGQGDVTPIKCTMLAK